MINHITENNAAERFIERVQIHAIECMTNSLRSSECSYFYFDTHILEEICMKDVFKYFLLLL